MTRKEHGDAGTRAKRAGLYLRGSSKVAEEKTDLAGGKDKSLCRDDHLELPRSCFFISLSRGGDVGNIH